MLAWSDKWNDISCGRNFYGLIEIPRSASCGNSARAPEPGKAVVPTPSNPTATVLHWRLGGNVADLSGNGQSAYLSGAVSWTNAPAGPRKFLSNTVSLYFNNAGYPQVFHPKKPVPFISGDASVTFMVWAYYDRRNWPSDWVGAFGINPAPSKGAFNNGVGLAIYQGNPCLTWYGDETRALNAINTRTWYHLAATRSSGGTVGQGTKVFVNGDRWEAWNLGSSMNRAANILAGTATLGREGHHKRRGHSSRYWNGYLKDARIYPSALPESVIKQIYREEW